MHYGITKANNPEVMCWKSSLEMNGDQLTSHHDSVMLLSYISNITRTIYRATLAIQLTHDYLLRV